MPRWSTEARLKQRLVIWQIQPWKKSTGPKTEAGKARSKTNSFKHGDRSYEVQEGRRLIKQLIAQCMLKANKAIDIDLIS